MAIVEDAPTYVPFEASTGWEKDDVRSPVLPEVIPCNDIPDSDNGAAFSGDRRHRYELWRKLGEGTRTVLWIMFNPSTADETMDDPTVRRVISFSRQWGFDRLEIVNLFSIRSSEPKEVFESDNPNCFENDSRILARVNDAQLVVVAWGTQGGYLGRDKEVRKMLTMPMCLGFTKDGHPKHPLYVHGDTKLVPFV